MFVDASALVAILAAEPEAERFSLLLRDSESTATSVLASYEASLAVARIKVMTPSQAGDIISLFNERHGVEEMPLTRELLTTALGAFEKFGKGRHRAGLNMGDCFSYACAKMLKVPLLCKGEDFVHTDIRIA